MRVIVTQSVLVVASNTKEQGFEYSHWLFLNCLSNVLKSGIF